MAGADIFVMPSRQEAFGLVAIEAMAMECPIVISSGGSAEEIVGAKSDFGLTIRPDDAFDLQRQLRYMLDNPMERVQMGQRGRAPGELLVADHARQLGEVGPVRASAMQLGNTVLLQHAPQHRIALGEHSRPVLDFRGDVGHVRQAARASVDGVHEHAVAPVRRQARARQERLVTGMDVDERHHDAFRWAVRASSCWAVSNTSAGVSSFMQR